MKCINCEYYNKLFGQGYCDIYKQSYRVSDIDAERDVPCSKYDRRKRSKKANIKNSVWIVYGHHLTCNNCGMTMCSIDREGNAIPRNFCPNCGCYNGENIYGIN